MVDFKFPDVGEGIQEGEIVKWLVKEGDTVKENQNLVQVETDKSVVDLPSPAAGKVTSIAAKSGKIKVGAVLCTIGGSSGSSSSPKQESQPQEKPVPETPKEKPEKPAKVKKEKPTEKQSGKFSEHGRGLAVVGQLEEAPDNPEEETQPEAQSQETAEPESKPEEQGEVEYRSHASTMRGEIQSKHVKTSPAVRMLAREHNINLTKIKGTGPEGRILKSDLSISGPVPQQMVPVMKTETPAGSVERIPLKGIRKAISDNMTLSHQIPQATEMEDVNITKLWAIREKEKKKYKDVNITLLSFVVKAAVSVLKENPHLNAYLDVGKQEINVKKYYNIGIAVETPLGLVVPNIKNADDKSIVDVAREIQNLAQKARDRKLMPAEMSGGTFTITNYGSIGGTYATPLINPGESAILGVGRIFEEASSDKVGKKKKILPLSLTFDHRIVDGAQAARFLETLKTYLEDPNHLFIELD